jgi:hypothetical protein
MPWFNQAQSEFAGAINMDTRTEALCHLERARALDGSNIFSMAHNLLPPASMALPTFPTSAHQVDAPQGLATLQDTRGRPIGESALDSSKKPGMPIKCVTGSVVAVNPEVAPVVPGPPLPSTNRSPHPTSSNLLDVSTFNDAGIAAQGASASQSHKDLY